VAVGGGGKRRGGGHPTDAGLSVGAPRRAGRRTGVLVSTASARRLASHRHDHGAPLPRLGGRRQPLAIKEWGVTRPAPGPWPWSRLSQQPDHWGRACAAARLAALATIGDQLPPQLLSVPSSLVVNPTNPSWSTQCAVSGCCESGMVRWAGGGSDGHHLQCCSASRYTLHVTFTAALASHSFSRPDRIAKGQVDETSTMMCQTAPRCGRYRQGRGMMPKQHAKGAPLMSVTP